MARPGRPERNRAARSFRQLRRFHHGINSDKVFGTHTGAPLATKGPEKQSTPANMTGDPIIYQNRKLDSLRKRRRREQCAADGSLYVLQRREIFGASPVMRVL